MNNKSHIDPYILYNRISLRNEKQNDDINRLFNTIRFLQKKNGNIFLYGKITKNIFKIILKIYHENIIRSLKSPNKTNIHV